jgi:hypothetical protein
MEKPFLRLFLISSIQTQKDYICYTNNSAQNIIHFIQRIKSENMMNVPDYPVEVIIAAFQICKYEGCPISQLLQSFSLLH